MATLPGLMGSVSKQAPAKPTTSLPGLMGSVSKKAPTGNTTKKSPSTPAAKPGPVFASPESLGMSDSANARRQADALAALPPAGTDLGYEVSPDGKKQRKKYADGKGGFTYGAWEDINKPEEDPEFNAILAGLKAYGIEGLAATLEAIRVDNPGISGEGLLTLLRNDTKYNANYLKRFSGNDLLAKAGKPMLDEKTYLANEAAYAKTFTAYELPQFANQTQYATLIGNMVSPDEAASRVSLAYDRILKSEPEKLAAFKKFYPTLSTADLVATMLDPTQQLPALERKVVSAEIGGAAIQQGLQADLAASYTKSKLYSNLNVDTMGAEAIQQAGVSASAAKTGYEIIAAELPTMEKLSSIYAGTLENYTQLEAEQEQFQGLASAKRKKQALLAAEAAQFSGTSGLTKSSLTSEKTGRF